MKTVVSIVEGDGEVAALPVLLRRLGEWKNPGEYINISRPIRVRRDQFLNKEEIFLKNIQLAGLKCAEADEGWILILLDADDDCPVSLASEVLDRAKAILPDQRVSVVLANREYEAWFLAAARSLDGVRGFQIGEDIEDPDSIRGAKEWLKKRHSDRRYGEVTDQPALSAIFDLERARQSSRSFRKLCSEWETNLGSLEQANSN
jgi:hypothetical protein